MMVIDQTIINTIIGLVFSMSGWILKSIWDALKILQNVDAQLSDKVNSIELLVAGQYVRKDEIEKLFSALFTKLDKISDKIDGKVDKINCKDCK